MSMDHWKARHTSTMATALTFGEDKGDEARAFPILYYDDHNVFPSLLPFIEVRLPLDGVPIKNPFSPHGAVYCNTLRLKFVHRDALADAAAAPKTAFGGGTTLPAGSAAGAKLAGTATIAAISGGSAAGVAASHAPPATAASTASTSSAASAGAPADSGILGSGSQPPGRHSRSGAASTVVAAGSGATKPFVYLQVLQLENIEDYKIHHRRVLRAWVDSLTEQHEEWLVLYVTPFSESETQTRSFRKILDKLRSDLNPPGSRSRERFLRVPTDPSGQYSHAPVFHDLWNAFILRLKEALAAAVEGRYVQLEDEVQRQTHAAEPRFCAVFTAKEDLAALHALCNRPDEALAVLDSLDLLRNSSGRGGLYDFQMTGSDALPWQSFFHTFGFSSPDAEVPVLFNQKRLARLQAALREDTISYVDFRQYLFARQAELLLRLNRLEELGARAVQLVSSLYKELLRKNISTGGHTWALLAALNFAGYIVAQSAVLSERSGAVGREAPEATPRSLAADEGSPWSSSRRHEFSASASSSTAGAAPYASQHPLLPLKYPTLASAARTLHRFTPLQFSFSPTRRGLASHRVRIPPGSSLQAESLTVPASAVSAESARESVDSGGVDDTRFAAKDGTRGESARAVNAAAAAAVVPAPAARYAGVLYGYAAQQLQRLIYWRERNHWHTPLNEIPLSDEEAAGKQRARICGETTSSSNAVEPEAAETAADDRHEITSDKKVSAGPRSFRASAPQEGTEQDLAESAAVDNESFFHPADMERLDGLVLIISRRNLIEELQTAAAVEDMLARIFVLAGQQYMNGGYYRHAALLQFRLAAANFKRGFLEECRSSLGRLLPLFLKEPWTELWLECQQLLCEADHRLGDVEAELRSAYVLSNVKAQYYSKRLQLRAALMHGMWNKAGGTPRAAAGAAAMLPIHSTVETADTAASVRVVSARGGSAGPAAEGDGVESARPREEGRIENFSLHPAEFLQRFIALARGQRLEHSWKCGNEAAAGRKGHPWSSSVDGVADSPAAQSMSAAADSLPAEKGEFLNETHATGKTSGKPIGVLNAGATEVSRGASACTCLSDPQFFERFCTAERRLHLNSSPNLYCWAALKAWWPSDLSIGEGIPRECLQPALALASASAQMPEPGTSLASGLSLCYGGGSVEGTPYTLTSMTPTGASTTRSFFSSTVCAASGELSATAVPGRFAALFPSRRHVWTPAGALGDGDSAPYHGARFQPTATAAAVRRGSRSRAEVGQELPHVGLGGGAVKGDFSFYVPRSPGASSYAASVLGSPAWENAFLRNVLRVKGSVDHDLLEHAVVRQLADLLPLYQLPFHPELGPHAYLFAYAATLHRLKPKSVAQVLGQHQRLYERRLGASPQDNVRRERRQRQLAVDADEDQTFHSELSTVAAAAQHEGEDGEDHPPSRPRSAIRAASEGTQKTRSRGSKENGASVVDTDIGFPGEAATPAGDEQTAVHRSSSGLSSGLREFRWRRSKTLTHVSEAATPKETADLKGEQSIGSLPQQRTQGSEQRSSGRNTKGAGRVSLLLSRRRRSTMTHAAPASSTAAAAASSAAAAETAAGDAATKTSSAVAELPPQASSQSAETTAATGDGDRLKQNIGDHTARSSAAATGGGTQTRLPEQFRSCAQQMPAAAGERSTMRGNVAADFGYERSPPEQTVRLHEAWISQAGDVVGETATTASPLPQHIYGGRRPIGAESLAAASGGGGGPRSRALSVLEMSSMQNVLPSLSVSLGQHIELQLYVHSCLAGPLPADYIAVRLSQLPGTCQDDQLARAAAAGGMRMESRLHHAVHDDAALAAAGESLGSRAAHVMAASSLSEEEKEELFDQQHRDAASSMWLVARSGRRSACRDTDSSKAVDRETVRPTNNLRGEEGDLFSHKLVLRPGVNRLSLLWSSRIEGIFVLEQICVGIGAASLVQWAGDLPLPDMMGIVAQTMQQVLLTASLLQQRWHRKKCLTSPPLPSDIIPEGADPDTGKTESNTEPATRNMHQQTASAAGTNNTSVTVPEGSEASGGREVASAVVTMHADSDTTDTRIESLEKSDQTGGHLSTCASHPQSKAISSVSVTTAIGADAAAAREETAFRRAHCPLLFKQSGNPLFQPVDCGNVASATAFDERIDPPTWILQQLALGCSPLAATLLQPVAPLERMLRPLIFEVRSPSTAVQIHVQPASPSDTFLFLDATNFFTIRIDVMPGLFSGPTASRLRVLQCLLPVVCPDEQQGGIVGHLPELQMQDSLLGDAGAPSPADADDDFRSYHGSTGTRSRRDGPPYTRIQRQRASMPYQGRSAHQERTAPPPIGAAAASPGLSLESPGTGGAGTWRKYFRGGGAGENSQTRLYQRYGSAGAAADADGLACYSSLMNYGSSSSHEMEGAPFGERRYGKSRSLAQTDKETLASPWTPATQGFDTLGAVPDEQQLFEASAVNLQFQWHQAVVHSVDGVPVHHRIGRQETPPRPPHLAAATGGTAARVRGHRQQQGEESRIQPNHHHRRPSTSEFLSDRRGSRRSQSGAAAASAKGYIEHKVDGVMASPGSDLKPSGISCGSSASQSYDSNRGTCPLADQETSWRKQKYALLRLRAEDEDGDVLALVPELEKSSLQRRKSRSNFCRADSAQSAATAGPPGHPSGGACWLELPPFQSSCEIVLPVIPVRLDEDRNMELYSAAVADAGTCDDTSPTEEALSAHDSRGMSRVASTGELRPQNTVDGVTDQDTQNLSGSSDLTAWRPHSGGETRVSMCQSGSSILVTGERQLQQVNPSRAREKMGIRPLSQRRFSFFGNENAVQLRPYASRVTSLLHGEWSEEQQQRWVTAHHVEDMPLPRTFSFRRRRSAFIVPPSVSSLLSVGGAEDHVRLLDGGAAAAAGAKAGTLDDPDRTLQTPSARAAQQISMAALLKHQQQLHEERQHGNLQQEQLRQQQQSELLQRRLSSAYSYACRPPPLEYHVYIVTTLQFYTRTGIPPAAAAMECHILSGEKKAAAPASACIEGTAKGSCWYNAFERGHIYRDSVFEGFKGETPAVQTSDLGIFVPAVYRRRTVAGRHSTLKQGVGEEFRSVETEKSGTTHADYYPPTAYRSGATPQSAGADGSNFPKGGSKAVAAVCSEDPLGREFVATSSIGPRRASSWRGRCVSPARGAVGADEETDGGRLQVDDPEKSDSFFWRKSKAEAHEKGRGLVDDVEEEDLERLEVCAEETICVRQQQQKELAELLTQATKVNRQEQEIIAGRTMVKAAKHEREKTETTSWQAFANQPATVIRASTSRVHRLSTRVALQHSQRLLHVSRSALLQQVLLSSCCSPAEPVIVESASIERLPRRRRPDAGLFLLSDEAEDKDETKKRTDRGNDTANIGARPSDESSQTFRDEHVETRMQRRSKQERGQHKTAITEKCRHQRRGPLQSKTTISLVAPPTAGGVVQAIPQEAETVRLDSLLFGEKVTALLVHLQHRRSHSRRLCLDAAAHGERQKRQRETSLVRDDTGRRGEPGDSSSDSKDLVSRRLKAAFEPKLEACVLSIRYRFLQQAYGRHFKGRCSASGTAASSLSGGDQEIFSDEAMNQATETTDPEDEKKAEELLVYKILLVFPVQQFPFEVRFNARRNGRVSSPLLISLVFANWSDVQLDVRHVVSLEFDDESGPGMRAAAKFFSLSPLLSSRAAFVSGLQQQCSRLYSAAGLLRPLDSSNDVARTFADWRSSTARRGPAVTTTEDPGKGSTGKKDGASSSRLGECHDWLMVGSKCKTTTVTARSRRRVQFQLVPLRAGFLPLPTIRVRIRPSREVDQRRLLKLSFLWQCAAGEGSALGIAAGNGLHVSAVTAAERIKTDGFSSCRQNVWNLENEMLDGESSADWWLPLPYGESVTAGREVLVLPKVVSKPDARLLPD